MDLSADELEELGRFFEKRFPDADEREQLLAEAGVDDKGTWSATVFAAADAGTLGELAKAAVERRPKDENLAELVTTLGADSVLTVRAMVIAAAALGLIALGAAAWYGVADDKIDAKPEDPRLPKVVAQEPEPEVAPVEVAPEDPPEPAPRAVDTEVEPEAEPALEPEPQPDEPVVPLDGGDGRCSGPAGALVGYWYAGHPFEPVAGDEYELKFGKFVRSEYPHRDNGWRADAEVRCTLLANDRVRISADPILVDGGKYWVPLAVGDLLTP